MKHLFSLLSECRSRDRFAFKQRLQRLQKKASSEALARLQQDIEASRAWVSNRRTRIPTIQFPDDLPVSLERERIQQTIAENQVTVLAGETDSEKNTQ